MYDVKCWFCYLYFLSDKNNLDLFLQDVLRDVNTSVFNEINRWVCESFNAIKSFRTPDFTEATRSFPIVADATCKKVFTGLVLTSKFSYILILQIKCWSEKMVEHICKYW